VHYQAHDTTMTLGNCTICNINDSVRNKEEMFRIEELNSLEDGKGPSWERIILKYSPSRLRGKVKRIVGVRVSVYHARE